MEAWSCLQISSVVRIMQRDAINGKKRVSSTNFAGAVLGYVSVCLICCH